MWHHPWPAVQMSSLVWSAAALTLLSVTSPALFSCLILQCFDHTALQGIKDIKTSHGRLTCTLPVEPGVQNRFHTVPPTSLKSDGFAQYCEINCVCVASQHAGHGRKSTWKQTFSRCVTGTGHSTAAAQVIVCC